MEQQDQGQAKHYRPPGPDRESDKAVVAEMLRDSDSPHWKRCWEFVNHQVQVNSSIPETLKDDITQNMMIKLNKSLQTYEGKSSLKYWLAKVVNNHVVDEMRRYNRNRLREFFFTDLGGNNGDEERNPFELFAPRTTEDEAVTNETLDEAIGFLIDFAEREAIRNPRLFQHFKEFAMLVLLEGVSLEDAAREYGIDNPHYLRRKMRAYLRQKMGLSPDNDQG